MSAGDIRFESPHWPTDIRVAKDRRTLTVSFKDGPTVTIAAELLRVESPSAEVQGHSAAGKTLVAGKAEIAIVSVEPVGNYAVRIGFDDGHSTGIYTWPLPAQAGRAGRGDAGGLRGGPGRQGVEPELPPGVTLAARSAIRAPGRARRPRSSPTRTA